MKSTVRALCLIAFLCSSGAALPAFGQVDLRSDLRSKFEADLKRINDEFQGVMGVQFVDLTDGQKIGLNAATVFPTASAIKVAILVELFRRADQTPGLLQQQRSFAANERTANSGMARLIGAGSSLALEDVAKLMINLSENTATNILIDELGMANVNHLTESLGLKTIKLQRKMLDTETQAGDKENLASPADAAALMTRIAKCDLPVSQAACAGIRGILEIPSPPHPSKDFIPKEIPVAFKWGGMEGVMTAWAIVNLPDRPYVFAIMTTYGIDNAPAVRAASQAAYNYFWKLGRANRYGARVSLESMQKARTRAAQPQ